MATGLLSRNSLAVRTVGRATKNFGGSFNALHDVLGLPFRVNATSSLFGHRRVTYTAGNDEHPLDALPDPQNPFENPLASLDVESLTETKKYWRKRQSESAVSTYTREVNDEGFAVAIGKRKSSVARVWLRDGDGSVVVNGKNWVDYFPRVDHRDQVIRPLFLLGHAGLFSVVSETRGGGATGQAEALRHGIARALVKWNPAWRGRLKEEGLLTLDSRKVESKKYGRKKARKSFTWVKR